MLRERIKSQSRARTPRVTQQISDRAGVGARPLACQFMALWKEGHQWGPSSLTELDASGEWGRGGEESLTSPEPSMYQATSREGKGCSEVLAWVGVGWGSSKYPWVWTSARP